MALENKMKEKMGEITSRQKVIIAVMIIVVLIIIWQIVGLMSNDGSAPPPPSIAPASKMEALKPGEKGMNNISPEGAPVTNQTPKMSSGPQVDESLRQASVVNDPRFNQMQRLTEEKYVGKLNELEELKIQRQIAETNQAISAAKLATVTAEKDISDLLTKPSPNSSMVYSVPAKTSADINPPPVGGGGESPPNAAMASETPKVITPPPVEIPPYRLVSVSMLLGKWTAVVSLQNATFSVGVGDILPPDGSVVTNINKNSITLRKQGKSQKVSITASI